MYKHPIPKQITTFEFKLIGFLTLKQFLYLVIFIPLGYIVFALFPIPYLNILLALLVASIGVALAFLKIQDRPLEVWIRNFIKSINSPTLYIFQKKPLDLDFLEGINVLDENQKQIHLQSSYYLTQYHQGKTAGKKQASPSRKKEHISFFFFKKKEEKSLSDKKPLGAQVKVEKQSQPQAQVQAQNQLEKEKQPTVTVRRPFLTGIVYSSRKVPLPGILVYIKDQEGKTLRLMKSNLHGVFATFRPLPKGEYLVEAVDPSSVNSFDTMNLRIEEGLMPPSLEIYAKQ